MELLSEESDIPPLIESSKTAAVNSSGLIESSRTAAVNNSGIYTPPVPRARTPNPVPRLSKDQEKNLINRLYRSRSKPPVVVTDSVPARSYLSAKSQSLTRGLEPIDVRTTKLIEARQKRLDKLTAQKAEEEQRTATGHPTINERSRMIAERLTPERRQQIVEQRRKLLIEESIQREKENCVFHPTINREVRRSSFSVTDRLLRDVEGRKQRQAVLQAERERQELAEVRPVPEISNLAKSLILKDSHVHDRLYPHSPPRGLTPKPLTEPPRVVAFNEWYSHHDPPRTPSEQFKVPEPFIETRRGTKEPFIETKRGSAEPFIETRRGTKRLDLSLIFSNNNVAPRHN
jgi:hypothetical protein